METPTRRTVLRSGVLLAAAAALAPGFTDCAEATSTIPALMVRRRLSSGRTYLIRPRTATSPGPVVIGLHGTAHDATNCNDTFWVTGNASTTGWSRHAAGHDYTLVLGEGPSGTWNVGNGWPSKGLPDDQYLLDVVADVKAHQTNVDAARVFVAGFSAGGAMAWRIAALYPQVFAACGSMSGWASVYPSAPIDCYHVHGTGDTTVPIRGGVGYANYRFPATALEAEYAPRGSRVVLYPTNGGHSTPGWAADRLWQFWTAGRSRP